MQCEPTITPEEIDLAALREKYRYERLRRGEHHDHLVCQSCGKVIEFEDAEHERVLHAIAGRLGFDLVSHRLELFGRKRPRGQAKSDE